MLLKAAEVEKCLARAREMSEQYATYSIAGKHTKRSIDDLAWLCSEYLEKHVEILELQVNATARSVAAMYMLENETYKIFVLAGLPAEMVRFTVCKELFHVILDGDEDCRSIDINAHLDEIDNTFSIDDARPNKAAAVEVLAEIAAMEFLFPYVDRLKINVGADLAAVAVQYGIPLSLIETYCSKSRMDALAYFHKEG